MELNLCISNGGSDRPEPVGGSMFPTQVAQQLPILVAQ